MKLSLHPRRVTALLLTVILALALLPVLSGCSSHSLDADGNRQPLDADQIDYEIVLADGSFTCDNPYAVAEKRDGSALVLVKGGVYRLTGQYNGQIQVSASKNESILIILDNLDLICTHSAPLWIRNCHDATVVVPDGSYARLEDTAAYVFEDAGQTKPNACIYASCPLNVEGNGALTVTAHYKNGIGCKETLTVTVADLSITATGCAIRSKKDILIGNGSSLPCRLTLSAESHALKAGDVDNEQESGDGCGNIRVSGLTQLVINCEKDVFKCDNHGNVSVSDSCRLRILCGGKVADTDGTVDIPSSVYSTNQ